MAMKQQPADETKEAMKEAEQVLLSPAVIASAASVALSWYHFFLAGNKQTGLFVGLWPPTILAFASYFNQQEMLNTVRSFTKPGGTIIETIEGVVGNR